MHNSVEDTFYTKSLQSQEKKLSLHNKTQKDSINGDHTERLSQEGECRANGESCILESASAFSQRVLEEIEALAGTTTCKAVQLVRLKKWAQEQGYWFCDHSQFGDFIDRGSENYVYLSPNSKEIIKLNDFRYSDDNLTSFFERIKAHNKYFPDCAYRMIGFAENHGDYYTNGQHDIFDAVDGNVLVDDESHLFFIDTIIYPSNTGGYDKYRSLSPRASK